MSDLIEHYKQVRARLEGKPYTPPKRDEVAELKARYSEIRKRLRGEPQKLVPPTVTIVTKEEPLRKNVSAAILTEICQKHDVTPERLLSKEMDRKLSRARNDFVWELRKRLGLSYRAIGRIARRSGCTVRDIVHAYEKRQNV